MAALTTYHRKNGLSPYIGPKILNEVVCV